MSPGLGLVCASRKSGTISVIYLAKLENKDYMIIRVIHGANVLLLLLPRGSISDSDCAWPWGSDVVAEFLVFSIRRSSPRISTDEIGY